METYYQKSNIAILDFHETHIRLNLVTGQYFEINLKDFELNEIRKDFTDKDKDYIVIKG